MKGKGEIPQSLRGGNWRRDNTAQASRPPGLQAPPKSRSRPQPHPRHKHCIIILRSSLHAAPGALFARLIISNLDYLWIIFCSNTSWTSEPEPSSAHGLSTNPPSASAPAATPPSPLTSASPFPTYTTQRKAKKISVFRGTKSEICSPRFAADR